jgi:hypothetical protein
MAESVDELGYQAKFIEGFDTADLSDFAVGFAIR